jgi:hypothetical protein
LGVQAARRDARAKREGRLDRLAIEVHVALMERDAAIAATERRVGEALRAMTGNEALSIRQAVEWCGGQLTVREATRLRRIVTKSADAGDGSGTPQVVGPLAL